MASPLASGIATNVVGGTIRSDWPLSNNRATGVLVGIDVLFAGSSPMGLGMAARSVGGRAAA